MSDLYLVLRSRLDAVTNWVTIDQNVLRDARKARGLSYEAVGRLARVSSKTYERYEKNSRVPEDMVETFADILGLEIERPVHTATPVTVPPQQADELRQIVREEVEDVMAGVETRLRHLLRQEPPGPPRASGGEA